MSKPTRIGDLPAISDAERSEMHKLWQNPVFPPEFRRELERIPEAFALALTHAWGATQKRFMRKFKGATLAESEARARRAWGKHIEARAERERAAAEAKRAADPGPQSRGRF